MKLTEAFVKHVALADSPSGRKYADGHGFYLHVTRTGKCWRMAYRVAGKPKTLALGVYPAVSLQEARQKADSARQSLSAGVDPSRRKKELSVIARESLQGLRPQHPGVVLRETVLPGLGLTTAAFAGALFLPVAGVELLLEGATPMTCAVALQLERLLAIQAEGWMSMQQAIDLWDARAELRRFREFGRTVKLNSSRSGQEIGRPPQTAAHSELLGEVALQSKLQGRGTDHAIE